MKLADARVLVVDCQSTGATPLQGALLELGWAYAQANGEEVAGAAAHLIRLPEGARIPRAVSRITGLTVADLAEAVEPERAWAGLVDAAEALTPSAGGGAPTIIHYASFERTWLRHLHAAYTPDARFPLDILCAHQLARRLLPDLPRRGIRALAGYFGFPVEMLRRSGGHVAATAFVWRHLVEALAAQGVRDWGGLAAWLHDTPVSQRKGGFPLAREVRLALPDRPGVYRMVRRGGDVLYVGKATSLRRRVNTYFTRRRGMHERTLEMLAQARELDVTVTATPLEAALLEADEIKRHRPPYNVHLLDEERSVWFFDAALERAEAEPDDVHRVGPMPSRGSLRAYAALRTLLAGNAGGDRHLIRRALLAGHGPDEACFTRGANRFVARHRLRLPGRVDTSLLQLSKHLARLQRLGELDEGGPRQDDTWDPDRVARHLERVVLGAGQLLRRSRWLRLLSEATVGWHEPGEPARRVLVVERGDIVFRGYLGPEAPLPDPPGAGRPDAERRRCFDIATYDRLRVLTTELKRISATSEAEIRLGPRHGLRGEALGRVLALA